MGRRPCCIKEGLNRGAWTTQEDKTLVDFIKIHGEGSWRNLPAEAGEIYAYKHKLIYFKLVFLFLPEHEGLALKRLENAGLKRCGKSCRLRWMNYLRPDIKRGNISQEEEELIIRLHKLLGNRWSLIAGRLPGRTDNEIKNYWNTNLSKKNHQYYPTVKQIQKNPIRYKETKPKRKPTVLPLRPPPMRQMFESSVVRTKASRCTRTFFTPQLQKIETPIVNELPKDKTPYDKLADIDVGDLDFSDFFNSDFSNLFESHNNNEIPPSTNDQLLLHGEYIEEYWTGDDCDQHNGTALDLEALASILDSEEDWL
ncbi:hypothetical protein GIB67_012789 [Kingdonia uniflora]|uniref:Uncharacterized protein n=1 Tax=Kingdonia uniflora TaxID=39325 RepID=A0A7J7NFX8_9MAGN|nr:hypothetical protein GIB67_012789 [Kingdonia uniflora]